MRSLATAVAVLLSVPSTSFAAPMPGPATRPASGLAAVQPARSTAVPGTLLDRMLGRATIASREDGEAAQAQAPVPVMTIDNTSLNFAALTSGGTFVKQTSGQAVRLSQSGAGAVTWTATSSAPWLQVSPASGSGGGNITVSVNPTGVPASGTVNGTVLVTFNGATTPSASVAVTLRTQPNGSSIGPFGFVDTPAQNATGVIGAIPVTGWAMDDVEVAAVSVCRAPVAGEGAGGDGRCGGQAQIYIGDAVFIEGARPDLPGAYPTYPHNGEAGWGTMVLTNFLPGQGNGVYSLSVWARDVEGFSTLLATRTITCDNAHANLPFGTIDTPAQGETITGTEYVNFGWALTQQPKFITGNLVTSLAYVDGVLLGPIDYGFYRSDIATLFPGLRNSNAAVGFRILEPVKLVNGLHTLVWVITDDGGFVEGLGSRYFRVANSAAATRREGVRSAATVSAPSVDAASIAAVPPEPGALSGRRGWAQNAPWRRLAVDGSGRALMQGEELDRFELQLNTANGETFSGYLRSAGRLQPLPVGSHLDPTTGVFTWSPGAGFVGSYDLVFVRGTAARALTRQEVRVNIRPKGTGPQVVIDVPGADQQVGQPFMLAGWAADLAENGGTGIDTLHVWAYPLSGGAPRFLGVAGSGGSRPDVAAAYGDQFENSGYGLVVQGLDAGTYDLAVFAWSSAVNGFLPARTVRVQVR